MGIGNRLGMRERVLPYMPALDGLRAIAVLAVLLYHGDVSWARGGYFGVDAFFVLSGFLITSLLLAEWRNTGTIDLKAFWSRRARRLLPALALVLVGVAIYAYRYAPPPEVSQLRRDGLTSLFYVANWGQVFGGVSYFEQFSPSALKHTWSLAIEEQFYLLWPLVVFGFLRLARGSGRVLLGATAVMAGASAVLMYVLYKPGFDPSRVYYGTDTRAQSLLLGAVLGMLLIDRPAFLTTHRVALHRVAILAAIALAAIWSTTSFSAGWQYQGGFLVAAALVCVVITSVTDPHHTGNLGRALSNPALRRIGFISYGVYLFHWPIYVYLSPARTGLEGFELLALRLAVTFAIATLSYVIIESPIRHGRLRRQTVRYLTPALAAALAIALVASTAGAEPTMFSSSISAAEITPPPVTPIDRHAAVVGPMRVMLVGDSVAQSMGMGLAKTTKAKGYSFWNVAVPGCGVSDIGEHWYKEWKPEDKRCQPKWRERWKKQVDQFRPDVVVMLVGAQDTFDRRINNVVTKFDTAAGASLAKKDLKEAITMLTARGATVVLLTTPYYIPGWPMKVDLKRSCFNEAWINRYNDLQREVQRTSDGKAAVINLTRVLGPDGHYTRTVNGITVRSYDSVHLSEEGSDYVAQWLTPKLRTYAKRLAGKSDVVTAVGRVDDARKLFK
jgi:peptidoglycan/LPS O-acetylase OafA/YrhL